MSLNLEPCSVRVKFKCACTEETLIEVKNYDVGEGTTRPYDPIEIEVAHPIMMCQFCSHAKYGEGNRLATPISQALKREAENICHAYSNTFQSLGCWGHKLKEEGREWVRLNGKIMWIESIPDQTMFSEPSGYVEVKLNTRGEVKIKLPEMCYGGQGEFVKKLKAAPDQKWEEYLEELKAKKSVIFEKSLEAWQALVRRGFVIEGWVLMVSSYDGKPDWRFLQKEREIEGDLVTVVWSMAMDAHLIHVQIYETPRNDGESSTSH
ncbi:hypothetical protein NHQ30_002901 [Ciborinia camelliae]|nr:hypothetical protein NHQ30_002901 [Ciborinia camelliae]